MEVIKLKTIVDGLDQGLLNFSLYDEYEDQIIAESSIEINFSETDINKFK